MKMEKIRNSGLGIVLAVLVLLGAGRLVRMVSWTFLRMSGYVVLIGILVFALSYVRNRN